MHERRGADGIRTWGRSSDRQGRVYDEERAEIATVMEPYKWYPQRAGRVDLVVERAKATGAGRRSGGAPGDRQAADACRRPPNGRRGAPRAAQAQGGRRGRRARWASWSSSHVARAAAQVHTLISRRRCDADRRGRPDGRPDRGDPRVGAGRVDRRRHRRDPAQHHLASACWGCRRSRAPTTTGRSGTCRRTS